MQPDPIAYSNFGPVPQSVGFLYSGILVQEDGTTPVPGPSILTITLTLTDLETRAVINSRNNQNVLNANQGTFDATGNTGAFSWKGLAADSPFVRVDPPPREGNLEVHQAILRWTWNDLNNNPCAGARKVYITVEKYLGADTPDAGGGSSIYTNVLLDDDGVTPIEDAEVWVTSDQAGQTLAAGPLLTDCLGSFTFKLNPGSYWLWMKADGFTFTTNPTSITVT